MTGHLPRHRHHRAALAMKKRDQLITATGPPRQRFSLWAAPELIHNGTRLDQSIIKTFEYLDDISLLRTFRNDMHPNDPKHAKDPPLSLDWDSMDAKRWKEVVNACHAIHCQVLA